MAGPAAGALHVDQPAGRWVLVATILGSGMAFLDGTVVNVALPRLGEDLGARFAGLQWVANGYLLTLASFILLGGSLGDRYGRRRIFVIGTVWFALASLACGLAPNTGTLVAARMLQGVGSALLTPGSLAMINASFASGERARAIGAWSGFSGVAAAVGPFVGGWLVSAASWRWVFLINPPIAVLVVILSLRFVPESRDATVDGPQDVVGAILSAVGLGALTFGLIEQSWPSGVLGVAVLVAFVAVERRTASPLLPLELFRSRPFSAANGATLAIYGALSLLLFLLGITLQTVLGYSPIEAGAAMFPITALMLVGSARAGSLAQRIGPKVPMTVGSLVIALGLLLAVRVDSGGSYLTTVFPSVAVFGLGLTITVAPLTSAVLAAVDTTRSGIASGVNNAVARTAGLLAVASLPLIAGFDPSGVVSDAELLDALHLAAVVGALGCVVAAGLSWLFVPSDLLEEEPPTEEPCYHCGVGAPPATATVDTAT